MADDQKPKRNLVLRLAFDGTAYHGWQVQKNALTVQQVMQDALGAVFGGRPDLTGCSRTDAGVHAADYACNFRTSSAIAVDSVPAALNAHLPRDIAVKSCREAEASFHARYSAAGKEYVYRIYNRRARDPFSDRYALHYPYPLRLGDMRAAAGYFLGTHDFAAFRAAGSSTEDTVRCVSLFEIEEDGAFVLLRVRADGFLYHMVRIMAGTLLYVSQGKIACGDISAIIASRDRGRAGPTAPAHGLCLKCVFYPGEET